MQKIEVGTLKGTIITNDLPEIMKSVSSSITDDSKESVESTMNQLSSCNKKLSTGIKQLNTYIDQMAEAFEAADKKASQLMKQATEPLAAPAPNRNLITNGVEKYLQGMA